MQALRGSIGRPARLLGALVAALGLVVAGALPAHADPSWRITRYDVDVVLDDAGTARVTVDLTFDLGSAGGHGPLLTLVTRQGWDATHDRTYEYDDIAVTSPDAPADLDVRAGARATELRVGDPATTVRGAHDYTLTYTARGLVNGASATGEGDQLYWNVLTDVAVPVEDLRVTVRAPGPVTDVVCHAGAAGRRGGCASAEAAGAVATFTAERVPAGGAMTVVAVTAAGTLGDPAPLLEPTTARGAALRPLLGLGAGETLSFGQRALSTFATDGLAGKILATGLGGSVLAALLLLVRRGRDRLVPVVPVAPVVPAGLVVQAPGGVAAAGAEAGAPAPSATLAATGVLPGVVPTAAADARRRADGGIDPLPYPAAEVGVLVDGRADTRDLFAAVLDLARRGYLRLETTGTGTRSPVTVRTLRGPDASLTPFDQAVLAETCPDVGQAAEIAWTVDALARRSDRLRAQLDADVAARGWFAQAPGRRRARWWRAGRRVQRAAWWLAVLAVGVQLVRGTEILEGAVWWCVGLWLAGGVVRLLSRAAVAVTPDGAAARRETARYRRDVRALRRASQAAAASNLAEHLPVLVALGDEKVAAIAARRLVGTGVALAAPRWVAGWEEPDLFYRDLPRRSRRLRRDLESERRSWARATSSTSGGSSTHGSSGGSGTSGSSSGSGTGGGSVGGW